MDKKTLFDLSKSVKLQCAEADRLDIFTKKQFHNIEAYWTGTEEPTIEGCAEYLLELFPEKKFPEKKI